MLPIRHNIRSNSIKVLQPVSKLSPGRLTKIDASFDVNCCLVLGSLYLTRDLFCKTEETGELRELWGEKKSVSGRLKLSIVCESHQSGFLKGLR